MGKEIECKLLAPGREVLGEIAQAFSPAGTTTHNETIYFDLGALAERKWMLRVRKTDDNAPVYTFKAPGEGYERVEFECEAPSPAEAVQRLTALGAPSELAQLAGFREFCGASFDRTAILLETGGAAIELALDEGVLRAPGKQEPVCEVELELKAGPVEPMLALRDELTARYGLTEGTLSKYARAQALAQGKEDTNAI